MKILNYMNGIIKKQVYYNNIINKSLHFEKLIQLKEYKQF